MTFHRILCPIDFSEHSRHALQYAEAFAHWYDAELHAVHVLAPPIAPAFPVPVPAPPVPFAGLTADARQALDRFIMTTHVTGPVQGIVREGPIVSEILDYATEATIDLIVLGTHGRTGLPRALLGSTAERVLYHAGCPVLVVPRRSDLPGSADRVRLRRIVCAVDFSPASLRAVEHGLSLAQENAAAVVLVHVLDMLAADDARLLARPAVSDYIAERKRDAQVRLDLLVSPDVRSWCDVAATVLFGTPARAILREADRVGADLLVMGAQGHSGIGLALLGSSTQTVVREALCPVLVTRR